MKQRLCGRCGSEMLPDDSYLHIQAHDHWTVEEAFKGIKAKHKEQRKVISMRLCAKCAGEVLPKVKEAMA